MTLREKIGDMLRKQGLSEAAVAVAQTLYCAVRATEKVMSGRTDSESRTDILQMLMDFALVLPRNPWFVQHGGQVMPTWAAAVVAKLDSYEYIAKDTENPTASDKLSTRTKVITTSAVLREVVVTVAMCDLGPAKGKDASVAIRDALARYEEEDTAKLKAEVRQ